LFRAKTFSYSYALLDDKRTKQGKSLLLPVKKKVFKLLHHLSLKTIAAMKKSSSSKLFCFQIFLMIVKWFEIDMGAEQSYWWKHRETGLQCKCRCDY
jgi:hypothetical protein